MTAGGHTVSVVPNGGGFRVLVDRAVAIDDPSDQNVAIQGTYEGGGRSYVLVAEASGGNACAAQFQAIDVTGAQPLVSPVFGTCSDLPDARVQGGTLRVTMKRLDGLASETYAFADGRLTTDKHPVDLTPKGPVKAPGNDLPGLVAGQYAFDLIKQAAVADPLRKAMGAAAFAEARKMALSGPSSPGELHGELAIVEACEAHNCGAHHTKWVFDRMGRAAATITRAGRTVTYGAPTKPMRALLG